MIINYLQKTKIKKDFFPTLLVIFFYLSYFLKMLNSNSPLINNLVNMMMIMIGIGSSLYILLFKKINKKQQIIINFFIFLITAILAAIYTGNYRFNDFLLIVQYTGVGLLLSKYSINHKLIKINFYFYVSFFIYNILIGTSPDLLFGIVSRNMISIIMLIQVVLYYITEYEVKKSVSLMPSLITLIISIWGVGRSGIISSLVLFIFVLLLNNSYKGLKVIFMYIGIILFFVLTFDYFYESIYQFAFKRSFIMGFNDQNRESILGAYLTITFNSIGNFLFGTSLNKSVIIGQFGNNLHNSYLNLHAFHGIGGVVLIVSLIIMTMNSFFKRKNYFKIILFGTVLLRISTDVAAFHGPFDPLFIYFVYSRINNIINKKNNNHINY